MEIEKEKIEELMKNKDEIRGVDFKSDEEYILRKWGKEGIKKVEKEMEKLGQTMEYKKISPFKFYPMGLRALSLLVIKDVFGMSEKEIEEMGKEGPKFPLFIRLLMRFFFHIERFVKEVSRIWREYHTTGRLEIREYSLKEKFARIRLSDHSVHPLYCSHYLLGYFIGVAQMVLKIENIEGKEEKCTFKGDDFHEYLLKW